MGYGMDQLSKKVASLVKKLAKLQREKIAYIKSSGGYMERRDDPFCSVHGTEGRPFLFRSDFFHT